MAQRLVLHPSTDLIETTVGDANDVERVGHTAGVGEAG